MLRQSEWSVTAYADKHAGARARTGSGYRVRAGPGAVDGRREEPVVRQVHPGDAADACQATLTSRGLGSSA